MYASNFIGSVDFSVEARRGVGVVRIVVFVLLIKIGLDEQEVILRVN